MLIPAPLQRGGDGFGKADGLTSFHTGITPQVTLQLSAAAEHRVRQHQCQTHIIPNRGAQNSALLCFHVAQKYVRDRRVSLIRIKKGVLGGGRF